MRHIARETFKANRPEKKGDKNPLGALRWSLFLTGLNTVATSLSADGGPGGFTDLLRQVGTVADWLRANGIGALKWLGDLVSYCEACNMARGGVVLLRVKAQAMKCVPATEPWEEVGWEGMLSQEVLAMALEPLGAMGCGMEGAAPAAPLHGALQGNEQAKK